MTMLWISEMTHYRRRHSYAFILTCASNSLRESDNVSYCGCCGTRKYTLLSQERRHETPILSAVSKQTSFAVSAFTSLIKTTQQKSKQQIGIYSLCAEGESSQLPQAPKYKKTQHKA